MILQLPRDTRITVREVTPTLRSIVQIIDSRWQGDRVSVTFTDDVRVELAPGDWVRLVNLSTGLHEPVERTWVEAPARVSRRSYQQVAGTICAPKALVTFRHRAPDNDRTADVFVHMDDFTTDADRVAALAVARDAYQSRDLARAQRIARDALPWCHGLFLALLGKEEKSLKARTARGEGT